MKTGDKREARLLKELAEARKRVTELERAEAIRMIAEDALQETERLYRDIYNIAPLAFVTWDLDCRITDWNKRAEEVFGWTREEVVGRNFFEFLIPDLAQLEVEMAVNALLQRELPNRRVNENLTKSGEIILCEWNNSIRYDSTGRVVGAISLGLDITERKRAEDALREGERFLSNIFASIQDGIGILDKDFTIIRVNPTMEHWYSHALPLVGKKCHEAYHGRGEVCDVCPTRRTLETGQAQYDIVPKRGSDGAVEGWLDLYSFPMFDKETGQLNGVIEYVRDITERKNAEEALKQAKNQLEVRVKERTEELKKKNEELESFVSSVSHDLQTPLRTIHGFSEALAKELADQVDRQHLDKLLGIARAAEGMGRLIGDMLTYASLGMVSFSKTEIPLKSIIIDAQFPLMEEINKRKAEVHVCESLPIVRGDERTLVRLMTNLLSNAIKFVPAERRPEVFIEAERSEKEVRVSVRDNGIGIAPQFREKIFRMFERLHSRDKYLGTGVGLAIAKKAVELHGGTIGVESEPDKGSTFWFKIPL